MNYPSLAANFSTHSASRIAGWCGHPEKRKLCRRFLSSCYDY
jgi:hypothetical protein